MRIAVGPVRRAGLLALVTSLAVLVGCSAADDAGAVTAAERFLDTYVDADGRVVRPDQGGTTVSEGQAYGLLLAQVAGDEERFADIWAWTRDNLQRDDALLAFLADEDKVLDRTAASDADLITAWALLRDDERYDEAGRDLAGAVLAQEVVTDASGAPVLVGGPWAREESVVNPSYWTLPAYRGLDRAGSDPRWAQLRERSVTTLRDFSEGGRRLPPDWGRLEGGELVATGRPDDPGGVPTYGLDAQRTVVWLATDCDPVARGIAASWWPLLREDGPAGALALTLEGEVADENRHPLPYVASAAAAAAAGDDAASGRMLERAAAVQDEFPSYFGGAWLALGQALLQTDRLDEC